MSTNPLQFLSHHGVVVPLDKANVDTDQIIPKQFLKSIKRTGFGDNLFDAWRFSDEGEIGKPLSARQPIADFVLNDPRYVDASILLARENFACGSSREHAVWALLQYGIRCVIAPTFADIFYNNSFNNGLLPITLPSEQVDELFQLATRREPLVLDINLSNHSVTSSPEGVVYRFRIDEVRKKRMLKGLDEIGLSLEHAADIKAFESRHQGLNPWLFEGSAT